MAVLKLNDNPLIPEGEYNIEKPDDVKLSGFFMLFYSLKDFIYPSTIHKSLSIF
jgi:hypothetical protein